MTCVTMTQAIIYFAMLAAFANAQFTTSDCEQSKGCFKEPPTCVDTQCSSAVSWKKSSDEQWLEMELVRKANDATSRPYVAVGFSRDDEMGDDSVTVCISDTTTGGDVILTYNQDTSGSPAISEAVSSANIRNKQVSFSDGVLYCKFERAIAPKQNEDNKVFDLNSDYYLLLAYGTASGPRALNIHDLGSARPVVSPSTINVAASTTSVGATGLTGEQKFDLEKSHGCLMIAAWIMMSTIAIFTARYYREYPDRQVGGKALWFQIHRGANSLCVIFFVAGAACIFVARGWDVDDLHPIIGLITIVLGILQPFNALMRCHPGTPKRPIFNWIHRCIGLTAYVLASATILLAVFSFDDHGLSQKSSGLAPQILLYVLWGIIIVSAIALEIANCFPGENRVNNDIAMGAMNGSAGHDAPKSKPKPSQGKARGQTSSPSPTHHVPYSMPTPTVDISAEL